MLNNMVIGVPTCNSLEYLKLLLSSWERLASQYKMVIVVDGSTDGTMEFLRQNYSGTHSIYVFEHATNMGSATSHNDCMFKAQEVFNADYVALINDDMVFGTNWDGGLSTHRSFLDGGSIVSLNLAQSIFRDHDYMPYYGPQLTPEQFSLDRWESFSASLPTTTARLKPSSFGVPLPIILSTKILDKYSFDPAYDGGGGTDADFFFRWVVDGRRRVKLRDNILYHFSNGAISKIKDAGKWKPTNDIFKNKWGIDMSQGVRYIQHQDEFTEEELVKFKGISDGLSLGRGE